eukprot:gene39036-47493_t
MLALVFLSLFVVFVASFQPRNFPQSGLVKFRLYEDFNLDFKNPKIISSKELFTEKQYREFVESYSGEEKREGLLDGLLGFFKKKDAKVRDSASASAQSNTGVANSLKSTVSLSLLEEKTAQFVKGQIDAKAFYGVLKAAFGPKLSSVLPEILSSLPSDKSSALSKVSK